MYCAKEWKISVIFVLLTLIGIEGYGQALPISAHTGYYNWFINPAFASGKTERHQVFANYRSQSNSIDKAQSYMLLGYSGSSLNGRSNYDFALSQEQIGVLRFTGLNANYAYGVRLGQDARLSMGVLSNFYHSSLATDELVLSDPDDEWLYNNYRNRYILDFMPGININVSNWDLGFAMRNFYSVSKNGENTTSPEEAFMGNLSYALDLRTDGVLEDAYFRPMVLAAYYPSGLVDIQGSLFLDAPKMGHLGFAYSSKVGWSANMGFNISRKMRLMYAYQMGNTSFNGNPNTIHELGLIITIKDAEPFLPKVNDVAQEEEAQDVFELKKEEMQLSAADRRAQEELAKMREEMARQDEVLEQKAAKQTSNTPEKERSYWVVNRQKLTVPQKDKKQEELPPSKTEVKKPKTVKEDTPVGKKEVKKSKTSKHSPLKHLRNQHVRPGHYIIASAFKAADNAVKYARAMAQKGYKTERIYNPERDYYYVAVGRYDTKEAAKQAVRSLVYDRFDGAWVYSLE